MNIDLFIYAKDAQGYGIVTAPPYWSEEMMDLMEPYTSLNSNRELTSLISDMAEDSSNHSDSIIKMWKSTYIMICRPAPYCCALLRWTRIADNQRQAAIDAGVPMIDREQRENWTLEGVCCPYEDKEEFSLYLPSLLLWLEKGPLTLFFKYKIQHSIQSPVNIPDNFLYNPCAEEQMAPAAVSENNTAWYELCNSILYSTHAFSFLYGPLADLFNKRIGKIYKIEKVFSDDCDSAEYTDPFDEIKNIGSKAVSRKRYQYGMNLKIKNSTYQNAGLFTKIELVEMSRNNRASLTYETKKTENPLPEIDLIEIEYQAERVRSWAKKNGWEVSDDEDDYAKRYSFVVEE